MLATERGHELIRTLCTLKRMTRPWTFAWTIGAPLRRVHA
jgi:hypothetical protein